jgi:hypothetical protein
MHGAALALGITGLLAEDFRHHAIEVGAPRHQMAMAAVGGSDVVVIPQRGAGTGGNGFLAQVQVSQTGHEAALIKFKDFLFNRGCGT